MNLQGLLLLLVILTTLGVIKRMKLRFFVSKWLAVALIRLGWAMYPLVGREKHRLQMLKRREDHLTNRIGSDLRDLSYDKSEASAINWILSFTPKGWSRK